MPTSQYVRHALHCDFGSTSIILIFQDGSCVNLYHDAPETIKVLVCRACEQWQFAKLAASRTAAPFESFNEQVLWQPPLAVLKNEAGGVTASEAAAYHACLKMQLWIAGEDCDLCDSCGEGVDSLEHRNWECSRTECFRAAVRDQFPNRYKTMMERGGRLFLELGLVAGTFPVPKTHPEQQETWIPNRQRFSGKVYIDGSAQFPSVPFLRQCGHAVVSLNDQVDWSSRRSPALNHAACLIYGPLKRQLHTVPASETMALLCAFRNADPPLQVGYDCKVVGNTWRKQWKCVGCAIVKGDHAPDCGEAQEVVHGVTGHHGKKQEEEKGELKQEVERQEEENAQTPVRMTMTMDEMEKTLRGP